MFQLELTINHKQEMWFIDYKPRCTMDTFLPLPLQTFHTTHYAHTLCTHTPPYAHTPHTAHTRTTHGTHTLCTHTHHTLHTHTLCTHTPHTTLCTRTMPCRCPFPTQFHHNCQDHPEAPVPSVCTHLPRPL